MFLQLREQRRFQRSCITDGDVLTYMLWFPHPSDQSADCGMGQDEAQGHVGKTHSRRQNLFQLVDALDRVAKVFWTEVPGTPVIFWKTSFEGHLAAQAAFIEGDAGNDTDVEFLADREKFVLGGLVEDVVDNLYGIDQARAQSLDAIFRLPA